MFSERNRKAEENDQKEERKMEGFIAKHPEGKEEWLVRRNGTKLRKIVLKATEETEIFQKTITTFQKGGGEVKSLEAFHVEKEKAKKKGFEIVNIDSSVSGSDRLEVVRPAKKRRKMVSVLGRKLPLNDEE